MYPNNFRYCLPKSLEEAIALFESYEDPKYLAGGHTLIPAMKNRLSAPEALIDVRFLSELQGIRRDGDSIVVGAATTHFDVSVSEVVTQAIPALAGLAGSIADPQVRHCGTIGGSLANNDPSADYPSAVMSLNAEVLTTKRTIPAEEFFAGMFTTILEPSEIITAVRFRVPEVAGYGKIRGQASRYALAGAFVSRFGADVRVAVTGAGSDGVFRWHGAEAALVAEFSSRALADLRPDTGELVADLNGNADYRAQLVAVVTRHAVDNIGGVYIR